MGNCYGLPQSDPITRRNHALNPYVIPDISGSTFDGKWFKVSPIAALLPVETAEY